MPYKVRRLSQAENPIRGAKYRRSPVRQVRHKASFGFMVDPCGAPWWPLRCNGLEWPYLFHHGNVVISPIMRRLIPTEWDLYTQAQHFCAITVAKTIENGWKWCFYISIWDETEDMTWHQLKLTPAFCDWLVWILEGIAMHSGLRDQWKCPLFFLIPLTVPLRCSSSKQICARRL